MDTTRLELLLNRYLDGELSPAERHELQALLLAEPDARRQFWRHARLHGSLRLLGEQAWGERDALGEECSRHAGDVPYSVSITPSWHRQRWFAVAAMLLIMLGGWWLANLSRQEQAQRGQVQRSEEFAGAPIDPFLAIVVDQSPDAKWAGANAPVGLGHALGRGSCLFENGDATLLLDNGVELQLRGPAELELLSVGHGILHRGQISARVPENAIGFRLDAPGVNVIDLGTEFSVAVDEAGQPKVHVFKGKVRAALPTLPETRTELGAGETARFDVALGKVSRGEKDLSPFPPLEDDAKLPHTTGDVRYLRRPPESVKAGTFEHDSIIVFEEQAEFTLPEPVQVVLGASNQQEGTDPSVPEVATLPAGTQVRSFYVHFDRVGRGQSDVESKGSITFDRPVLGLVIPFKSLAQTDAWLAHSGTGYESGGNRLLEMRFMGWKQSNSQRPNTSGRFDEIHLGPDGRTVTMDLLTGWAVDQFRVLVAVEQGDKETDRP